MPARGGRARRLTWLTNGGGAGGSGGAGDGGGCVIVAWRRDGRGVVFAAAERAAMLAGEVGDLARTTRRARISPPQQRGESP